MDYRDVHLKFLVKKPPFSLIRAFFLCEDKFTALIGKKYNIFGL